MPDACLNVGVLAQTAEELDELVRLVKTAGHHACALIDSTFLKVVTELPDADAWLVSSDYPESARLLLETLDLSSIPVVYNDEGSLSDEDRALTKIQLREKRAKKLSTKLELLTRGEVQDRVESTRDRAKYLWVLAASTGGPKAISEFLDEIPAELSEVAFLYVQHIDSGTMQTLKKVVDKHSAFNVQMLDVPRVIREKTVYLVPPSMQIDLLDNGVITPLPIPWKGDYSPSIDQVIAKVARVFANRGGAIIFTGMGDDGAKSSKLLHHRGGEVWVQSADSCAIDSMPVSVQSLMQAGEEDSPAQLAKKLVARHSVVVE